MKLALPHREVLAWQTLVELARRHPAYWILELHPGGGQYDCRSLVTKDGNSLLEFNLGGSVHPHEDDAAEGGWAELVARGPFGTARRLGKAVGLSVTSAVPPWNRRTLTYAFIASALNCALAYDSGGWTSRNGYFDSSNFCSVCYELFESFPRARQRLNEHHPHDPLNIPAYRFWFLLRDGIPLLAVETSGQGWTRDGQTFDLFSEQDPQATALRIMTALLSEAPGARPPLPIRLHSSDSLAERLRDNANAGHWTALPEDLSVDELDALAHMLHGYDLAAQALHDSMFAVAGRIARWHQQSGVWQGSTVELLITFFWTVRGWRGLYEGPAEGDSHHLEALGIWQAVRARLMLEPKDVVLVDED